MFLLFMLRLKQTRTVSLTNPAHCGLWQLGRTKTVWMTNSIPSDATSLIIQSLRSSENKSSISCEIVLNCFVSAGGDMGYMEFDSGGMWEKKPLQHGDSSKNINRLWPVDKNFKTQASHTFCS